MARRPSTSGAPKATPAAALAARLEREAPEGVVVLAGGEAWFRARGIEALVAAALPAGDPGGSLVRIDGRSKEEGEQVAAALDELRTATLFGGRRIVVVEYVEAATWHSLKAAALVGHLAEEGLRSATGSWLVLSTGLPVKGRGCVPTASMLRAGAWVIDCRPLYDAPGPWERGAAAHDHELSRFLVSRMRRAHGKRLALDDAHVLSRLVGNDLGRLEDALESLTLYLGARDAVTAADIERTVGATREDPVWRLVDAVLDGETAAALDLSSAAFERGLTDARGGITTRPEALQAIITAALHGAFRRILAGAEALARGEPEEGLAKAQGVPPFLASRFVARCRRDPARLLDLHGAFLEAETGSKGGGVPPRLATERLVVTLVRGLRRAVPTRP